MSISAGDLPGRIPVRHIDSKINCGFVTVPPDAFSENPEPVSFSS